MDQHDLPRLLGFLELQAPQHAITRRHGSQDASLGLAWFVSLLLNKEGALAVRRVEERITEQSKVAPLTGILDSSHFFSSFFLVIDE